MKRKVSDKLRHQVWIAKRCSYLLPAEEVVEAVEVDPSDILPAGQDITAAAEVLAGLPPVDSVDHLLETPPATPAEEPAPGNPISE